MIERRLEGRFLCADLVTVEWLADVGSGVEPRTVEAVLEDISALGACVQVEERIPPGSAISIAAITGEHTRFLGHVSYCVYRDYGYFAGIRFADETRWSSRVFEPQHLIDLKTLMPSREVV
jgi:hypothetical protein